MAVPTGLLQYTLNVGLDRELRVIADPDNRLGHHIGNGIWTSAHEQALFIGNRKQLTQNRSVLELGSGLGLVGQVKNVLPSTALQWAGACQCIASVHWQALGSQVNHSCKVPAGCSTGRRHSHSFRLARNDAAVRAECQSKRGGACTIPR